MVCFNNFGLIEKVIINVRGNIEVYADGNDPVEVMTVIKEAPPTPEEVSRMIRSLS